MFLRTHRFRSLWMRMFLQQTLVILVVTAGFSAFMAYSISSLYKEQIGKRALAVSRAVAHIPDIRRAFADPDPSRTIQPIADGIRQAVGAEFVVVGNLQGIRYSHPLPDRLGLHMVGGDNGPALQGQEYVSVAKGSLGVSIRGKVPVRNDAGEIIGLVSTGYLMEDLDTQIWKMVAHIAGVTGVALLAGAGATYLLAGRVKKQLFDLEPEEIATILQQREAILENSEDPIIATDRAGQVILANRLARALLSGVDKDAARLLSQDVDDFVPGLGVRRVIETGKPMNREPLVVGQRLVIATCVPVRVKGTIVGAVCTFRDRTDVKRLEMELSSTRQYTEALRAQRHQFQNQLHVIAGLLFLGEVRLAAEYLDRQIDSEQPWIDELRQKVEDPILIGLLVAKRHLAEEAGVALTLDPDTRQSGSLDETADLVTLIVGHLIDNAVEAVSTSRAAREVRVGVYTEPQGMWIRVADNGLGIDETVWERMWDRGVSVKGNHRGMGLPLILQALRSLRGWVRVKTRTVEGGVREVVRPPEVRDNTPPGVPVDEARSLVLDASEWVGETGTVFTVFLPRWR